MPDVQSTCPDVRINLTRVGVKNVKKLVEVSRADRRPVIFISNFDVFVDLPGSLKGANLSRNFEVIDEVLQQAIDGDVKEIENLCSVVARKLLDRHEYADRTEVLMRSEFMVKRETPVSHTSCHEVVKVHARAVARQNFPEPDCQEEHRGRGNGDDGMSVCPEYSKGKGRTCPPESWRRDPKKSTSFSMRSRWPPITRGGEVFSASRPTTTSTSNWRRLSTY